MAIIAGMNKIQLPKLKEYLSGLDKAEKESFADRAGTSLAYLYQLSTGHRKSGVGTMVNLEKASNGFLTPSDIRPDLYKK